MPPELTLIFLGIATAAGLGIQQLIKAVVSRQVKRMQDSDEEARLEREQNRQREMEAMRAETAKAQEDAAQAKAIGENLTNLNTTIIRLIDTYSKEAFADREVQSNNLETIGNLSESVDKVALAVVDNTSATKATGQKADAVVAAIDHLEQILNSGIREIKLMLVPPPNPPNVVPVNAPADSEKPADDMLPKAG